MKRTKEEIQEANLCLHLMFPNLSTDLQYRFRNAIQTIGFAIDEIEEIKEEPMNQQIEDKIVLRVLARFNERSQVGITKYNTTLEREDYSLVNWLREAQAEAMDFALYCEAAINRIEKDEYKSKDLSRTMPKQQEQ